MIIETNQLYDLIKSKENIKVLDCSFFLPTDIRKSKEEFMKERIPGSIFFDIDDIADKNTNLPHMIISNELEFIEHMKRLEIGKRDFIVCYDRIGLFSSPRVWFNLTIYGANNVFVLNGGYPKWVKEGYPVEIELNACCKTINNDYDFKLLNDKIVDMNYLINNKSQIIDARSEERYLGTAPEPRPTLKTGHIKGAVNIFFKEFVDSNWCYRSVDEIEKVFKQKQIDLEQEVVFYCGSGVSACINLFAMCLIGKFNNCKLYDGSWAELVIKN